MIAPPFEEDHALLRDQTTRLLDRAGCPGALRPLLDAPGQFDKALWRAACEQGWPAIAIAEDHGGLGLGPLALCVIAEEIGRTVAPLPFTADILFAEALTRYGSTEQRETWLPRIAIGEALGCLAFGQAGEAGPSALPAARLSNGRLSGTMAAVPAGLFADAAVVWAQSEHGAELALVELTTSVRRSAQHGLDNSRGYAELVFDQTPAERLASPTATALPDLLDFGATLVAFEQTGGARQALAIARDYALERRAFGQPIAQFQAIKHRLADMYGLVEIAYGNCLNAALALQSGALDLPFRAAAARHAASKAYDFCSREGIHIFGGLGVTWEADPQLYYRRGRILALELGGAAYWRDRLVDACIAAPPLARVA